MKRSRKELDEILDTVIEGIRSEETDHSVLESARERAWAKLSAETSAQTALPAITSLPVGEIRGCNDFQALIPAYLHKELSGARALLVEDHIQECIPCRKVLKAARTGSVVTAASKPANVTPFKRTVVPQAPAWRWAIAATLVLSVGFGALAFYNRFYGRDPRATIQAVNGSVYRVTDSSMTLMQPGDVIGRGERVRTARDSNAVVALKDGSAVEMRERSELFVSENSGGTTINLSRGNVIVEAAKQRDGHHLYVATNDSLTSVVGTVFSVNNGTKGTRVSVVEGEVRVNHAGSEEVLHPGDQTTTNVNLERVTVQSEVAWSRKAERYAQAVASLSALRKELNKVQRPGVRYTTRFLNLLPEGTVLYAALPNLVTTLSESNRVMQERIAQNPALKEWWAKEDAASKDKANANQIMERVREFGEYLGEEIVVSAEMNDQGEPDGIVVMGELKNASGFRPFLEKQIAQLGQQAKSVPNVRIVDDPATAAEEQKSADGKQSSEMLVWITQDFFVVAPRLKQLQQIAERMKQPEANAFTQSPFYARISEIYRDGAGLVVAADLQKIIAHLTSKDAGNPEGEKRIAMYRQMGLLDLKHFIVEQKEKEGRTYTQAALTFNEQRKGVASWLAQPGPMGSLEFISPEANIVAAFVVKEPVSLVDDLLGYLETASPGLQQKLKELETEHGLNLKQDIAAPLGGEYAFAIDGPVLPTPSWKMIFEVYDQAKLQQTLERVVEEVNKAAAKEGKAGLKMESETVSGRTFYTLKSVDFGLELHYAYVNGYMIAAASRALVNRAIQYREAGQTLLQSARFRAGLPADGNTNFSAVFYHDLAPLLKPLADRVQNSKQLPKEGQEALQAMSADAPPTLAYAYAQGDRITLASNTDGGPFGLSPASILGMPNSFALQKILTEGMSTKSAKP